LHPALPLTAGEVRRACREEMARRVEDVLARRSACLLLDAAAAVAIAPAVAGLMAEELGRDAAWVDGEVAAFTALAAGYLPHPPGKIT
jgi:glycerol-3-phosphate dehydrogenase